MNINTNSQYMDKQIMDLSDSHGAASSNNNSDSIDFMNRQPEKKDDILPSYDFMPIRPVAGSSSPPPPGSRSSIFNSAEDDVPPRTWNSFDSKANASSIRNYSSLDADEAAKFTLGKNHKPANTSLDASLVSEIDRTMKKYMDNLMHAIDGMSARLSQLDTRNRNLEHLMDDLKVSVGNTHGSTEGKMRQLENILREVQTTVQDIKDKQDIVEAQLKISKLHLPKTEQVEHQNTAHTELTQPVAPAYQQFSTVSPTPNAPSPPPPQQNFQPQSQIPNQFPNQFPNQIPNQFPQNQVPSVPQQGSYFPPSGQNPENPSQQYQVPPNQPQSHNAAPPPPQYQYQQPTQTPYSQPAPPSQPHQSFPSLNPTPPQPPLGHHSEELPPYPPPQSYTPGIRPSLPHPSNPPPQQFYGPSPNMYEPPSSRPGSGYSGHGEPYPYSGSPRKPQSSQFTAQSGGIGYPQLPTARILPQALPTASAVGSGSGSGSGNKVPIDDVVERVTNMGFPRDQVRATVRKLTENGEAVDLNIVLDKLMNGGDTRGYYGR